MAETKNRISLYVPPAELQQWREDHAQSYPQHRLSFNAWLLRRIRGEELRDKLT